MSRFVILILMVLVIGLPFAFRPAAEQLETADLTLVVISPHNESIRYEITRGFREWYKAKTGKTVDIDWRVPGGTSEIVKYINSEFYNAFRNYWERTLKRPWTATVQNNFFNGRIQPADTVEQDSEAQAARRAFLESDVGIGLDIFFGGGAYDFEIQASAGSLADSGILARAPERFSEAVIPRTFKGENFYDAQGLWVGSVLSTFGILYNTELIERQGIKPPSQWEDLAQPALFSQIGVSDPSKSGSMNKAFEMIVQQQMQARVEARQIEQLGKPLSETQRAAAIAQGWNDALQIIQNIAANARYFTDSATKPVIDVSQANCTAAICIDFYGRFQEETIAVRTGGDNRVRYVTPEDGTTVSADPIAMFRGAPSPELALDFIDYVTSETGQKLWSYQVGVPEGPTLYALRRNPIRKDLYTEIHAPLRSDPTDNPYTDTGDFVYHADWTAKLFNPLRFIITTAFMNPHHELTAARRAIIRARAEGRTEDAQAAEAVYADLSRIDYSTALDHIRPTLRGKKIDEVQLAKVLGKHFREQYTRARRIAEGASDATQR